MNPTQGHLVARAPFTAASFAWLTGSFMKFQTSDLKIPSKRKASSPPTNRSRRNRISFVRERAVTIAGTRGVSPPPESPRLKHAPIETTKGLVGASGTTTVGRNGATQSRLYGEIRHPTPPALIPTAMSRCPRTRAALHGARRKQGCGSRELNTPLSLANPLLSGRTWPSFSDLAVPRYLPARSSG